MLEEELNDTRETEGGHPFRCGRKIYAGITRYGCMYINYKAKGF